MGDTLLESENCCHSTVSECVCAVHTGRSELWASPRPPTRNPENREGRPELVLAAPPGRLAVQTWTLDAEPGWVMRLVPQNETELGRVSVCAGNAHPLQCGARVWGHLPRWIPHSEATHRQSCPSLTLSVRKEGRGFSNCGSRPMSANANKCFYFFKIKQKRTEDEKACFSCL